MIAWLGACVEVRAPYSAPSDPLPALPATCAGMLRTGLVALPGPVRSVAEDAGGLWIATGSGVSRPGGSPLPGVDPGALATSEGALWVAGAGLVRVREDRVDRFEPRIALRAVTISGGRVWAADPRGRVLVLPLDAEAGAEARVIPVPGTPVSLAPWRDGVVVAAASPGPIVAIRADGTRATLAGAPSAIGSAAVVGDRIYGVGVDGVVAVGPDGDSASAPIGGNGVVLAQGDGVWIGAATLFRWDIGAAPRAVPLPFRDVAGLVAAADGGTWVLARNGGAWHLAGDGRAELVVPGGPGPSSAAAAEGMVWVAAGERLLGVDVAARRVVSEVPLAEAGPVAATARRVAVGGRGVALFDPAGLPIATTLLPVRVDGLATVGDTFVAATEARELVWLDEEGGVLARSALPRPSTELQLGSADGRALAVSFGHGLVYAWSSPGSEAALLGSLSGQCHHLRDHDLWGTTFAPDGPATWVPIASWGVERLGPAGAERALPIDGGACTVAVDGPTLVVGRPAGVARVDPDSGVVLGRCWIPGAMVGTFAVGGEVAAVSTAGLYVLDGP